MKTTRDASHRIPFGMLMLILVLAALDQTILSTALPVMARDLPGHWPLAWVFSAYLMVATVVITLYGRLADLVGRKPMLLLAIGLFLLGSLACGVSQDLHQLVLSRAIQGAGGGGLMTLTMLSVAEWFPPEQRGRYQGLLGAAYGLATMFGPLVGGTFVEHLSWRWAFWMNVPLALLALGVLALAWPARAASASAASTPRGGSIDWLGALLLTGALVSLLLATQHGKLTLPDAMSLPLLLMLCGALVLAFLWRQHRAASPLLPLSLFARPAYAAASVIALVTGMALYAVVVFVPQYLQIGLHLSPTGSAWHLLPLMAGVTGAAIASGRLLRAQKPVATLARTACVLMLSSFGMLIAALHWWPEMPSALSASLLPLGVGLGLLFPVITVVAQRVSPAKHMGIATAVTVMLRSLGGAVGVAVLASLLTQRVTQEMARQVAQQVAQATAQPVSVHAVSERFTAALAHSLQPVFGCVAAAVLLALLASRWMPQGQGAASLAEPALRKAA